MFHISGAKIRGYYTILYNSGARPIATEFTPHTFTTTIGYAYSVRVDSYGDFAFSHWASNGKTINIMYFTATSSTQTFTAVHSCS